MVNNSINQKSISSFMHLSPNLPIVTETASYFDVVSTMSKCGLGIVFVCKGIESLVGIITDGDLRRCFETKGPIPLFNTRACDILNKNFFHISPECSLIDLLKFFAKNKISCVPVINNNILCGAVTLNMTLKEFLDFY